MMGVVRPDTSCHLKSKFLCCIPDKGGGKCLLKQYGVCCAFRLLSDEMLLNASDHLFFESLEKSYKSHYVSAGRCYYPHLARSVLLKDGTTCVPIHDLPTLISYSPSRSVSLLSGLRD